MINALFGSSDYVAAKKFLDVTALRHEAIASNLSNVETPGYKRIDVDPSFENQLKQAVSTQDTSELNSLQPSLATDNQAVATRLDGNTVSLENEMLRLDQNLVEHSLETQLISGSLMKLKMAISGKS